MRLKPLSRDRFESIYSNLNSIRDKAIALLFYEVGLKASELVALSVSHFKKNLIVLENRELEISKRLSKILNEYFSAYTPTNFVFFTRQSPQMTVRRVEQILKSQGLVSPQSLRRAAVINAISTKPIDQVRNEFDLKSLREKQYLAKSEYKKLQEFTSSKRDSLLFALFYELGLTISQVTSLRISNFKKDHVTIPKEDARLTLHPEKIVLSKSLSKQVHDYIGTSNLRPDFYLFASRQSSQISDRRIQQIFKSYALKLDLEISPQILANSARVHAVEVASNSFSHGPMGHSLVSQTNGVRVPRLYEGYYPKKGNGGGNEIT